MEAPAIESTVRRSRTAAEPTSRSRLLGPERSREHETNSECIQLPETGPEGRIYRQLGAVRTPHIYQAGSTLNCHSRV